MFLWLHTHFKEPIPTKSGKEIFGETCCIVLYYTHTYHVIIAQNKIYTENKLLQPKQHLKSSTHIHTTILRRRR